MSALYKGTQALIQKEQPLAYYTSYNSLRLNLVCKSVVQSKSLHGSLSILNYISVLFSKSENLEIYTNLLIMITPDSNQCVLQDGHSDVRLYQQS